MLKYDILLWDVDGTLLDFQAAERAAIRSLFADFSFGECTDEMIGRYSAINREYWNKLERGEMTKPQILEGRFREFFEAEGLDISAAAAFNTAYQERLGDTIVFRDDSFRLVESLRGQVSQLCRVQRDCSGPDEEAPELRVRQAAGRRVPLGGSGV